MAKVHSQITPALQAFIEQQQVFFVASAPLSANGHVNLSPKGLDAFRVLSPARVAYLDLTGSGNETSAHLQENGRITILFCGFTGQPQILRLYGRGTVVLPGQPAWETLCPVFELLPGTRQIIVTDVERVQTSCGFGVPLYEYQGQRSLLPDWAEKQGASKLAAYQVKKGTQSIDGLPTPIGDRAQSHLSQS